MMSTDLGAIFLTELSVSLVALIAHHVQEIRGLGQPDARLEIPINSGVELVGGEPDQPGGIETENADAASTPPTSDPGTFGQESRPVDPAAVDAIFGDSQPGNPESVLQGFIMEFVEIDLESQGVRFTAIDYAAGNVVAAKPEDVTYLGELDFTEYDFSSRGGVEPESVEQSVRAVKHSRDGLLTAFEVVDAEDHVIFRISEITYPSSPENARRNEPVHVTGCNLEDAQGSASIRDVQYDDRSNVIGYTICGGFGFGGYTVEDIQYDGGENE